MCPNIQAYYNEAIFYFNFGTPKNNEFSIWNKWKIYYYLVSQYLSTLGYEPPYQDLRCLQIQLFSSLVFEELITFILFGISDTCDALHHI